MLNPVDRAVRRGELLRWLGWLVVVNTLVLSLIALRYLDVGDLADGWAARTFGVAMFFAHFVSVALIPLLPVMLLALIAPLRHVVVPLAWAINVVLSCLLLVDTLVFQQYRFHLNGALVALFFSDASAETFEFSTLMKIQAGLIALGVALAHAVLARLVWRFVTRTPHRRDGYAVAGAFVVLLLGTNLYHAYADAAGRGAVTRQTQLLPGYEPLTAKGFLADRGYEVARAPRTETDGGALDYPREPLDTHRPAERPNILFIVIDSWRGDAMNAQVSPHIAEFARENTRFTRHYSGGNATRMGMFSLFYGIPGTYWQSALNSSTRPALVNRLQALGYDFGIFRSAPLSSPEFDRTIFAHMPDLRMESEGHSSPARDIDANRDFIAYLDDRDPATDPPFFGLVFHDSPHAYDLPDDAPRPFQPSWDAVNYLSLDEDTDPTGLHNLYRNSVHFVDGLIGKVFDKLEAEGLMDETIVIVTGDHGQEFNDLGLNYWGHNGNFSRYQTRVPMIVHWPGRSEPGRRVEHLTSFFDVAPTLLDHALGVDNAYRATSVGHDLFEPAERLPLIMARYRRHAAMTEDGFIEFPPIGPVKAVDRDYRPRESGPSPAAIRDTLEQMTRFRETD